MTIISEAQIAQFHREGYFVLESAMPLTVVAALREECQRHIDEFDRQMEARGVKTDGINHYKRRYFVNDRGMTSPVLRAFLLGDLMADVVKATLGDTAFLFNEQFVIKAADGGNPFAWHQDSGYIPYYHKPYLTCWCALDDMSIANGTIYVLPYSRDGREHKDLVPEHTVQEGTNDRVGYHGDDPGVPVIVPEGSIVVFSSRLFHRSGANTTDRMRRSYVAQYSREPIMNKEGTAYRHTAVPFIANGQRASDYVEQTDM